MRYVVLDTNALIQALPTKSPYHRIWSDFLGGKYRLCVSNEILSEYAELLRADTCDTRRSKREVKFSKCQVIKTLLCVLVCVQSSKSMLNGQKLKANKCTGKFYTFSAK